MACAKGELALNSSRPACTCRGLHSVTAVGSKLYLFGGAPQKGGMLNDLWLLDTASMQWTELQPKGQLPHVRCSHTAVVMGTSIVIFGGSYYRYTLTSRIYAIDHVLELRIACTFDGFEELSSITERMCCCGRTSIWIKYLYNMSCDGWKCCAGLNHSLGYSSPSYLLFGE